MYALVLTKREVCTVEKLNIVILSSEGMSDQFKYLRVGNYDRHTKHTDYIHDARQIFWQW